MNKDLVKTFKGIVDNVDPTLFPVTRGNKINIGSYSIKPVNNGYLVKSYITNEIIAETYSKSAAIAIARTLSKKQNFLRQILDLDKVVRKHDIDCVFYEYTLKVTKNPIKYESTYYRYDISKQKTKEAKEKISRFIFK